MTKISQLFSPKRFQEADRREEEIENHINNLFTKYVSKNAQWDGVLNTTDLHTITRIYRQKNYRTVDLQHMTDGQRKRIITYYANQCLALWSIVRTKTRDGRTCPTNYPWLPFIDSAMSLFEEGFFISPLDHDYKVTIIEKDSFLALLPDDKQFFKRENPTKKSKKNTPTKIKNHIKEAFYDAVNHDGISPESLRPEDVTYDSIPHDIFIKLKGKNKNSQPS